MENKIYQELGQGITCIDANYGGYGLACFYLLEHEGRCAIIETGTALSIDNLLRCMADKDITAEQVQYVVPTHVHLDHAGGAGAMMQLFPRATLLIHPKGAKHLVDPTRLIASSIEVYGEPAFRALYGEICPVEPGRIIEVTDGMTVELAGRPLLFRHTRGHADHHFCVWDEMSRGWFSGDMFGLSYSRMRFARGDFVMPTTTPTQFRPQDYVASVELLRSFSPRRMYLTHYGELLFSDVLADHLCLQIEAYQGLAASYPDQPAALAAGIVSYTLDRMATIGSVEEAQACRSLVEMDAKLNAQGLVIWLNRMKKSAPGA